MQDPRGKVDVERAKLAPTDEFDHPDQVLAAPISDADKVEILNQWEIDAKALARAGDEGMADGEPSQLHDVQAALQKLRKTNPETAPEAPG